MASTNLGEAHVNVKVNVELNEETKQMIRTEAIQGFLAWLERKLEDGPSKYCNCPTCQLLKGIKHVRM